MNTISKLSITSALALLVVAGPSFAQTAETPAPAAETEQMADGDHGGRHHGGKHGGRHGEGRGGKHRGMMMIDANADGVIGEDEAAAMAQGMFARHDQNRDNALSLEEFTSHGGRGHGKGWFNWGNAEDQAAVVKSRTERFEALDVNKDKSVSIDEFFAEAKTKLAAADTDKDGKVTPWEFRATMGGMKK
jgi:EF hand